MICAAIGVAVLAACGGGGDGSVGTPTPAEPVDPVIGEAVIGPGGGTLAIISGANTGLSLTVPAGVVDIDTKFRAFLDVGNPDLPSQFPVYRIEPSSLDFGQSSVAVTIPAGDALFVSGDPQLTLFSRVDDQAEWNAMSNSVVDSSARTVTASVSRLGEFVVSSGVLHRLFTQELRIFDPAEPVASELLFGSEVAVANGSLLRTVGAGSLASFWTSPASENVLIIHGVIGSPLDFLGSEDLVANLAFSKSNVVLLSFPSARGIAYIANELYDLIDENKHAGFGCSIIGHSIGGLIGRYLIEQSHKDPNRSGYRAGAPSFDSIVEQLVMLGPPNSGAQSSTMALAAFEAGLPESERELLQVAADLNEQPGSLPLVMNQSYVDNSTFYDIIYGDLGSGTDGVVTVMSALALPLTPPETSMMFFAPHDDLHQRATSLGIAVWIGTLMQAR
jgi:pimeloyl-ACP methyl ester carboxylesterase